MTDQKGMTITYKAKNGIYVNMTNRCPCACTFCLRQNAPGVYGSDPLWLEREPTVEEVEASLSKWDLNSMDEVVFCGYGEPAERLKDLLEVAAWLKKNYTVKTRINTNGLADLIWGEPTAPWLEGKIDAVSISLNAIDAEEYLRLTRSKFGIGSYDAMLRYTHECTKYVPTVMMTVVDQVTTPEEQESARKICEKLGATLRVRPFESCSNYGGTAKTVRRGRCPHRPGDITRFYENPMRIRQLPNGAMWASPLTQTWKAFRKVRRGRTTLSAQGKVPNSAEDFRVSGMHFAGRTETSAHMGYQRISYGFARTALCRHSWKGKESGQTRRASARFSDQRRLTAEKKAKL